MNAATPPLKAAAAVPGRIPKRKIIGLLIILLVITSCSTPPVPPAGQALIRPMALRNTQSRTFSPHLVIREIDGRSLSVEASESPVVLHPGPHTVTVTMLAHTGSAVGNYSMGAVGNAIGNAIDMLHSAQFESQLSFRAEAGHTYRACVMDDGRAYRYWIEDETTRRVVAGSRYW